MTKNTVIDFAGPFVRPIDFSPDPLTDVLRAGACELLARAVRAEVSGFIALHADLPEREVMTGIGEVPVQVPPVRDPVRDRGTNADGSKVRFNSPLVPPYLRKARSVEELLPWFYLKGIPTGGFSEALASLAGPDAEGLSAPAITRLKSAWWDEYEAWRKRGLTGKRYVCIWVDGLCFNPHVRVPRERGQLAGLSSRPGKTGAMPQPVHEKARGRLQDISMAETRKEATAAFGLFVETCGVRYERAVKKLTRDRDLLLMFCDYPPDTGNTSGRQTQSKAPSPPSGSAENAPKGVSAAKQPWPWPSN